MQALTNQFKQEIVDALMSQRENFDGAAKHFAQQFGIKQSIFSRMKLGKLDGLLRDAQWLNIGRMLNVGTKTRQWKMARTDVFEAIEREVLFCKEHSKSKIFVDECGIGKTYAAKYLARHLKNCFYVDASQAKSKILFIKLLAQAIGVDPSGNYNVLKANIKYFITTLPSPIFIIDEAGDLQHEAFLDLKEMWNATEGVCGWYLIGADGLRAKISRGITGQKVGYRELFSRYSEKYTTAVPTDRTERKAFFRKLISDVLSANVTETNSINDIVNRCLTDDRTGNIGGLRRAESLLILQNQMRAGA